MCCKCIGSNPLGVLHFRNVLGNMWRIYRWRGHPCHSVISTKVHSSSFLESCFRVRCSPVDLLRRFPTLLPYCGMDSEGLLLLHHRLQVHCIVNVNTCRKWPDDETIVFCRSLANTYITRIKNYVKKFCKRKNGKKTNDNKC